MRSQVAGRALLGPKTKLVTSKLCFRAWKSTLKNRNEENLLIKHKLNSSRCGPIMVLVGWKTYSPFPVFINTSWMRKEFLKMTLRTLQLWHLSQNLLYFEMNYLYSCFAQFLYPKYSSLEPGMISLFFQNIVYLPK